MIHSFKGKKEMKRANTRPTLEEMRQPVVALNMLIHNHLPPRLQQPKKILAQRRRLRHRTQHLHASNRIDGFRLDAEIFLEPWQILNAAWNERVDIAQAVSFDVAE